ncbi:MAG: phenylalanine--tRNA ligase subunit beta [Patescibacteria group bacterium]|nr:phenylalanine--tRNA ligase subunit beta [Patescibacteria group bacterium]
MYLSLNWLKDFIDIPKSVTPEDLGLKLTMHTVEIDRVINQKERFDKIVVGKILELKKHPSADRLQLVKVDIGKEKLDIVCGATNIKAGDFVPVALVGAILPNGMEIKAAEIRGVKSSGMLCAEDELGIGEDHTGIMILTGGKVGQNLAEHFKLSDTVFEVDNKSITNRPDLWSHFGMAREIAAFLGIKLKEPKSDLGKLTKGKGKLEKLKVEVKDSKLCPRYMAIKMNGIAIGPSPEWMQEKLSAVGMRPISNIVDITNYVMLELGQPLHAFDASLVKEIGARRARKGEEMETLDGQKRELDENMLLITDGEKGVAVAGVMGGLSSEINDKTSSIIIEAANFEPVSIRKTSQKLGLRTESSMRFEKSLDPNLCELAIARTVELVKKLCPKAEVASDLVDIKDFKLETGPIELNLEWLEKIIGQNFEDKKIIKILEGLGFAVRKEGEKLEVAIPTWRATKDISIPEDLVEEIVRIYGYNNLKPEMPKVVMEAPRVNRERMLEREIKEILAQGARLAETYNYSFVNEGQLKKLRMETRNYVKLANPIVSQHTLLRQSLAPNLLENIKTNQFHYNAFGLFEIGNVFMDLVGEEDKGGDKNEKLPYQEKRLGIILAGEKKEDVFRKAKGMVEYLFNYFGLAASFEFPEDLPGWADTKAAVKIISKVGHKNDLGLAARLDNQAAAALNIKKEVAVVEIRFKDLVDLILAEGAKQYERIPKYPPVVRDLAFVAEKKILYKDIKKEIEGFSGLVKEVELFDVYEGESLGEDNRNLAFHIIYQSPDRTLTAEEIEKEQEKLIKLLKKKFKAQIRNF